MTAAAGQQRVNAVISRSADLLAKTRSALVQDKNSFPLM